MGEHTPGPWGLCYHLANPEQDAACPCGYRGGIWGPDGGAVICEMGGGPDGPDSQATGPRYPRAVELANARLIAAAPDLLAAAQDVVERWETPLWKDAPHTAVFIARLRSAINTAVSQGGNGGKT